MKDWGVLFYDVTTMLSLILLGISLLIGGVRFFSFSKGQKWFLYYLGFDFITEMISKLLIFFHQGNLFLYPFYISGEFILLSTMFIVELKLSRKWFVFSGLISVYLFSESFFLWMFHHNVSSGIGKILSHLIIVCMVGYYFIHTLKTFENEKRNRSLLIYGCLFLYYVSSIFLFLLLDQLSTMSRCNASVIWGMNNALSCVLYGVSSYTFLRS